MCEKVNVYVYLYMTRTQKRTHAQMAECRGQLLKEQKARHALMLRKERLEAEVIRLHGLHEGEARARRTQVSVLLVWVQCEGVGFVESRKLCRPQRSTMNLRCLLPPPAPSRSLYLAPSLSPCWDTGGGCTRRDVSH